jgi:hypothetical protein
MEELSSSETSVLTTAIWRHSQKTASFRYLPVVTAENHGISLSQYPVSEPECDVDHEIDAASGNLPNVYKP